MQTDEEKKAKRRERLRKWRANNLEKDREKWRKWRANNLEKDRERSRERARKWRATNPEKAQVKERRGRVAAQFAGVIDKEVKGLLIETKILQLQIKRAIREGRNEKHS